MTKRYYHKALSMRVLVVAIVNKWDDGFTDWAVYIDAVKGKNHNEEFEAVAKNGTKLDYRLAKILFPTLDKKYVWRD